MKMKKQIIFITGPTAVGKTDTAIVLAKKIGAEIISCDSMQVYKGMDIITSKPTARQRRGVRHHLIGVVPVNREYNVSAYRRAAEVAVKDIIKRGSIPLFVGGTGLYVSVLVDGIFQDQAPSENIRLELYAEAQAKGSANLHAKLQLVDPQSAIKIHPHDTKRIVRALEVFTATGKPISVLQQQRSGLADKYDLRMFCLSADRQALYARIDARVERMLADGLIEEVRKLLKRKLSKTASYAIGIKELAGYLSGEYNLEQAKRLMQRNSRWYAKRQLTWFRKDKRIIWISLGPQDNAQSVAQRIIQQMFWAD